MNLWDRVQYVKLLLQGREGGIGSYFDTIMQKLSLKQCRCPLSSNLFSPFVLQWMDFAACNSCMFL